MSDHHGRYFKDHYGSSGPSKRYYDMDAHRGNMSGGSYYDGASKRSKSDSYGSFHTSSSSSRYDYSSSSSNILSSRYKTSSYYDGSKSSKYDDDYKGSSSRSTLKSSVRRIPPPLTPPSYSSKSKSSMGSSRPPPLMKINPSGSSSGGRYDGASRLRAAPPEHHSSSHYSSSGHRRPDFRKYTSSGLRPSRGSARPTSTAFRRPLAVKRVSVSQFSKIRPRFMSSRDDKSRKRSDDYVRRKEDHKSSFKLSRKDVSDSGAEKDSDKEEGGKSANDGHMSADDTGPSIPDGENTVIVEEVCEDTDDEEQDMDNQQDNEESNEIKDTEGENDNEQKDEEHKKLDDDNDNKNDESPGKHSKSERESTPTRGTLLKLYCKYCDVRAVTFRDYSQHLRAYHHTKTMNLAVMEMKRKLTKLRMQQRDDQRRVEKEEKAVLSDTTSFCRVCELNYCTDPKEHEANELHNVIKTLIYQRCDICDIDFRIWKVHLYHMAALEHVKRVAMKELKEAEITGDKVKGTNLSPEELGPDLVEVRTVFFCNACVRYLPIKGDIEDAKIRHCMTLTHVQRVEEFRQREKRIAERQRARMLREEREKKLKEEREKEEAAGTTVEENVENWDETSKTDDKDTSVKTEKPESENDHEGEGQEENNMEDEQEHEVDEDEIELHAGDDVPDDESEDANSEGWNRRTRSSSK